MFLCGRVNVSGPEFDKKDVTFESKLSGEFYLHTKKGAVPKVDDFSVWIEMDDDKEILIVPTYGECGLEEYMYLEIKSKEGGTVSLSLSVQQASAIAEIFEHFRETYYGLQALNQEKKIKIV